MVYRIPISLPAALLAALLAFAPARADEQADKQALTQRLWPKERIEAALRAVQKQRTDGLLGNEAYQRRRQMLQERLAGAYRSQSLSTTNPPLNFIQNAGFEKLNKNSARNRSRWLWWAGWDWGGDYENSWEDQPAYVHSGQYSARIRCTGQRGRIGIFTPALPQVPQAKQYLLTFWAKGEGDNQLFVNFEGGATGTLRQQIGPEWKEYTLTGTPTGTQPYHVYFYVVGGGTIWLDDMRLVPEGGKLEDEP